jgi:hypothetical protein
MSPQAGALPEAAGRAFALRAANLGISCRGVLRARDATRDSPLGSRRCYLNGVGVCVCVCMDCGPTDDTMLFAEHRTKHGAPRSMSGSEAWGMGHGEIAPGGVLPCGAVDRGTLATVKRGAGDALSPAGRSALVAGQIQRGGPADPAAPFAGLFAQSQPKVPMCQNRALPRSAVQGSPG